MTNGQPTAIVYRTVKGWGYGIEGRASHGAGHKLCSDGFYQALGELSARTSCALPSCEGSGHRCEMGRDGPTVMEECFYDALLLLRKAVEDDRPTAEAMAARLDAAQEAARRPRPAGPGRGAARRGDLRAGGLRRPRRRPSFCLEPGTVTTLRGELGRALQHYNKASGGALLVAAADLLGSTSVNTVASGFGDGFWNAARNPAARTLSIGGICEDAMAGILSGLSTFGRHVGRRLVLRRLPRAARAHRGAPARDRRAGEGSRTAPGRPSSSCAPTPASRPARTGPPTPTRSRCSCCRRTSRAGR